MEIIPDPSLDLATPVGKLFARGPIEIVALKVKSDQVRIGITAGLGFLILRSELNHAKA